MHISSSIFGRDGRFAWILLALIALKLALLFAFAWHSRFVMDEFLQLGYAKYLGNGLFETVEPPKALGFTVFIKLAHLAGNDAVSILLAGRVQTAVLACATVAMVYACARALGEDTRRALAIVLVLLSFSNFLERIFRTIAEPLAVFFAVASLLVISRGRPDRPRDIVIAGIFSGLAFLATQKSVYFNLALGLALIGDAAIGRRYTAGVARGALLVAGWLLPLIAYCYAFGGTDPIPIAKSLIFGPVEVATLGGAEYGGLRGYVLQTLSRNLVLYAFCFVGIVLGLIRLRQLDERKRVAVIFTAVITALVFAHDQPWPYVFIMALPFMSLWALAPIDRLAANRNHLRLAWIALAGAVLISYVNNVRYLRTDNGAQLALVARAEALVDPDETYFDGIAMLPNRLEPSDLWLDRHYVLKTLREREKSEAYAILSQTPPKIILWSYRTEAIYPVIAPAIRDSYVRIAPNVRLAGRRLRLGKPEKFVVPIAGTYRLYDAAGQPVQGQLKIAGKVVQSPIKLAPGIRRLTLQSGPPEALLLPEGVPAASFKPGPDDPQLFANIYD